MADVIPTNPISAEVSAITGAYDATLAFVAGVMPPTQSRIDRLKITHCALYQRVRLRMENKIYQAISKETKPPVTSGYIVSYVLYADNDLVQSEQDALINVLFARFGLSEAWPPNSTTQIPK